MSLLTREDKHPATPLTADAAWKLLQELAADFDAHIGMPMDRINRAWTLALLDLRDQISS